MVGGLTTAEIARAYLVSESTVAQRIVRAKRTIAAERVPYEVPGDAELTARLDSVLEVIYLIFNEGYSATSGNRLGAGRTVRGGVRLARILAGLMPAEPEVHGLAALLELQSSRVWARGADGQDLVLLADQDRAHWDRLLIRRGFAELGRAHALNHRHAESPDAMHYKRPSPPRTRWQRRPRRPTGGASPVSTPSSRNGSRPRSWN